MFDFYTFKSVGHFHFFGVQIYPKMEQEFFHERLFFDGVIAKIESKTTKRCQMESERNLKLIFKINLTINLVSRD